MICYKCNKQIPSVSTVCPYCSSPVDPNHRPPVDFGNIENTTYDTNTDDLKTNVKKNKSHKSGLIGIIVALAIIVIFAFLILSMFKHKSESGVNYFINEIDKIYTTLEDNYFDNNSLSSGEYNLSLSINGENMDFNGKYARDINSKIFKIDGTMSDPSESSGGIILESKEFNFNSSMKNNNLYFKSEQLFNDYLEFKFKDSMSLLTSENYDIKLLTSSIEEVIKTNILESPLQESDEVINYRGSETKTKKYYFKFDKKAKIEFLSKVYTNLADNSNFVNEYAKLKNKKNYEIIKYINDEKNNLSSKCNDDEVIISINVYKKDIVRICYEIKSDKPKVYQLEIKNNKYFFDYFHNGKSMLSITLLKSEEEVNRKKSITYTSTCDFEGYNIDIKLTLKPDEVGKIQEDKIESFKNINSISEEEIELIKNNLNNYIEKVDFFDKLLKYFKNNR